MFKDWRTDQTLKLSAAYSILYLEILKWTLRLSAWFIHPGCDVKDSKLFPAFKVSNAFKDKSSKVKHMKVPVEGTTLRVFWRKGLKGKKIRSMWGCGVEDLYRYFYNLATYGDRICSNAFSIRLGHHLASTCSVFRWIALFELVKRGVGVCSCLSIQSFAALSV